MKLWRLWREKKPNETIKCTKNLPETWDTHVSLKHLFRGLPLCPQGAIGTNHELFPSDRGISQAYCGSSLQRVSYSVQFPTRPFRHLLCTLPHLSNTLSTHLCSFPSPHHFFISFLRLSLYSFSSP